MRHQLRRLSASPEAAGVIKVRNVAPRFFTTTAAAKAGKDPPQPMSAMCGYRYLISVAGYGYSNRLKSLYCPRAPELLSRCTLQLVMGSITTLRISVEPDCAVSHCGIELLRIESRRRHRLMCGSVVIHVKQP